MQKKLKVIISGGGTGGHIYPAIAVAQALQQATSGEVEFLFVGAAGRMEMEKVPKAGFPIIGLWISGFQRSAMQKNLLVPFKILSSVGRSIQLIKRFKPDVAIGFGGYASGAMMYAAALLKVPTLIHEQNSFAGITNKILKNRVNRICVAYEGMERFFPSNKIRLTGNPVRQDISDLGSKRNAAMAHFQLDPTRKTVLVLGGSLGARSINNALQQGVDLLLNEHLNVIWQKGNNFPQRDEVRTPNLIVQKFIYEMDLAYAAADLVISRAGALSIAELALAAKPVILVPSPHVAEDHQTMNAMALVSKDAALLVKDVDASTKLISTLIDLANDTNKQQLLQRQIAVFAKPEAAKEIVTQVFEVIDLKRKG